MLQQGTYSLGLGAVGMDWVYLAWETVCCELGNER